MSMRRTWAIFTFCQEYPVLIDRWQNRAAALRAAGLLSVMGPRDYHVVEQLLPDNGRAFRRAFRNESPACDLSDAEQQPRLPSGMIIDIDNGSRH